MGDFDLDAPSELYGIEMLLATQGRAPIDPSASFHVLPRSLHPTHIDHSNPSIYKKMDDLDNDWYVLD